MKKIDYSKLEPGDIILTTSLAWESKVIRRATDSDISHAMLCVAPTSVMDSTGDGVQARNPQKLFYHDECAVYVLRLKEPLPDKMLKQVIDYVRNEHGTEYNVKEAIRSVTGPKWGGGQDQFCSRLVARAFSGVGIQLVENADFCTPAQLKASPLLMTVEGAVAYISEEEVAAWENNPNGVRDFIEVSNEFLKRAREISSKIRTVNDPIEFVMQNPNRDDDMVEAYQSSGYLDFWKMTIVQYPWRYDLSKMLEISKSYKCNDAITNYCLETIREEEAGGFNHWKCNLEWLQQNPLTPQLNTLSELVILYENLVKTHMLRVQTAKIWLELDKNGLAPE